MPNYSELQYQKAGVLSADRGKLLVILYEGAINYLNKAKECIEKKDIPGKSNNLNRAQDILQELTLSLKMQEGGEIARNLKDLYWFMEKHLVKAKIEKNGVKKIEEVIAMLTELSEAWKKIMETPEVKSLREANIVMPTHSWKGIRT